MSEYVCCDEMSFRLRFREVVTTAWHRFPSLGNGLAPKVVRSGCEVQQRKIEEL
jgi:hypothetical protein